MEDVNDDFGELYADVEFQASSAINGVPDISQLCVRQQQQEEQQPLSNELSNDSSDASDAADDDSGLGNGERREKDLERGNDGESEVVVESGSDSDDEDDFDIVVNDDDVGAINGLMMISMLLSMTSSELLLDPGYDIRFPITNFHCEEMQKRRPIDFIV